MNKISWILSPSLIGAGIALVCLPFILGKSWTIEFPMIIAGLFAILLGIFFITVARKG